MEKYMERRELAHKLHMEKRYNCAQAVACSFKDLLDMSEEDIFRAAEAFGFGMGSMGTCGAVSGMALVTGLLKSDGAIDNPGTKRKCYRLMSACYEQFQEKNGSVICKELKGTETGRVLRSCDDCIMDAAEILSRMIEEQ